MNTGFTERSPASQASFIQHASSSDKDPHALDVSDSTRPHQHSRTASQSQTYHPQLSASTTLHPPAAGAGPSSMSMYQVQQQPRASAYPSSHHYLPPSQQAPALQSAEAFHSSHHLHPQAQHQAQMDGQQQLQRGANQGFSVPRSINTSAWSSTSNAPPAVQLHITPANNNAGVPSAPLSSSSAGSLMSYWEQGTASDGEPGLMASSAMPEMLHSRYPSSATSLPTMSPTAATHPSSSYLSGSSNSHGYLGTASEHHHYRPSTALSMNSVYPSTSSGLPYPVSNPVPSSGFMYSPSSASSSLAAYDAYAPTSSGFPQSHSQYVSYLPPALGADSRGFYPLNPFEIKHRRRTTKTQFRVLESTFREIPKPNAALRKQISAQLDMPVRAVQIWFQNRRAKAKAMEKKRPGAGGAGPQGQGEDRARTQERYAAEERPLGRSMDLPPLRIPTDAVSRHETSTSGVTLLSLAGSAAPLRERRPIATTPYDYADHTRPADDPTTLSRAAAHPRTFDDRYRPAS